LENVAVNPAFWNGRRVFVTGHTGFKGSWLTLWLQSMGARVTGYSLPPPTQPSLFDAARVGEGIESIISDVRDLPKLREAMGRAEPEVVLHLAAQPLVRHSYVDPVETYSTNVLGTVHVLEAVRATPSVKAVVSVTTDKCYENREWLWGYRESDRLGGRDPYSNSKACAELVTSAYRSSFFGKDSHVAVASARAGNVIGGGDWARDRLVPDIIAAWELGRPTCIRSPHSVRPWQHVLEPLRGYLILAEKLCTEPGFAEAWNFGPLEQDARPVQWIVKEMARLWGPDAKWDMDLGSHPHEAGLLKLDIAKASSRLGWRPALGLQEALKMIVEWSRARAAGKDVRELTLGQIEAYQEHCKDSTSAK
jgi:CDP-glucose 4,6-dehydratase